MARPAIDPVHLANRGPVTKTIPTQTDMATRGIGPAPATEPMSHPTEIEIVTMTQRAGGERQIATTLNRRTVGGGATTRALNRREEESGIGESGRGRGRGIGMVIDGRGGDSGGTGEGRKAWYK